MPLQFDTGRPVFEAIVPGLMGFNPYQPVPNLPKKGVPIGRTKDGPFVFNPHAWQRARLISSPGIVIMGAKDHGKTSLAKYIAYLMGSLNAFPSDPTSRKTRIWVDDSKAHEWAALAKHFNSEPFHVRNARLNPLDTRMALGDQEFIVRRILEQASGRPVDEQGKSVLSSALESLRSSGVAPSLHQLVHVLVNHETMQPATLYDGTDVRLPIPAEEFRQHALDMALRVSNMLRGAYGSIFGQGTDQTVFAALAQQMVAADYSGANEDVTRIMQMLFWIWKRNASENRGPQMVDYNVYDETYALLRHIEFTRPLSDTIKRLRENASTVVLITHAIRDYKSIGGEAGSLAYSLLSDMPIWFVGKMTEKDAQDVQDHFNCSRAVRDALTSLPFGMFMAFIGDLEPFPFQVMLTPQAKELTFSNQALRDRLGVEVS